MTTVSKRWPWNCVRSFRVSSLANGNLLVEPQYDPEKIRPYTERDGGGPGLFTRMALAEWAEKRLTKRKAGRRGRRGSP